MGNRCFQSPPNKRISDCRRRSIHSRTSKRQKKTLQTFWKYAVFPCTGECRSLPVLSWPQRVYVTARSSSNSGSSKFLRLYYRNVLILIYYLSCRPVRMSVFCHDPVSRFVFVLSRGQRSRPYILPEDLITLVQDVVDTHPGLAFLKEASEFHSRYVHTVIARIFYTVNRSWTGRITLPELRRSNLLQVSWQYLLLSMLFKMLNFIGTATIGRGGRYQPNNGLLQLRTFLRNLL